MTHWIKILVETNECAAGRLAEALEGLGAIAVSITGEGEPLPAKRQPSAKQLSRTSVSGLFEPSFSIDTVSSFMKAIGDSNTHIRVETIADRNWELATREQFVPFPISDNLWICPSWHTPPKPDVTTLIIDPGAAFGTGYHPTTALCLRHLAGLSLHKKRVLDWGCGSGILAIGAYKLGADSALGVDIDPQALAVSQDNAERNGIHQSIRWVTPEAVATTTQFEIVVANILANPLIALAPILKHYTTIDGTLMLSGVTRSQTERVMAHYRDTFSFDILYRQEWALLVGRKRPVLPT
ncbi:MAG TPA: 50S ribosomal protein L11 methyltransferase [Gammaproteobacteria bacterium]|nr:50S ribosomal protein L11 methyltransferase [Gammaproteobacteria bacterium]HIL17920.1 50S ribosomal protein L11 methyltransferase [Gammaproteobacteria bacterium]